MNPRSMSVEARLDELTRRLDNVVRVGTVIEADYMAEPPAARVDFGDYESGWMPFMTRRANGQETSWDAPELGERVTVLAISGDTASAQIMPGALYCDENPAPAVDPGLITRMHDSGAHDTYDQNGKLRVIQVPAGEAIKLIAGGASVVITDNAITLTAPTIILNGETHLGGTGGKPVARKDDTISHDLQKITKGSDNVFSK